MVFHGKYGLLNQLIVLPLGQRDQLVPDQDFILAGLVLQTVWRWTVS